MRVLTIKRFGDISSVFDVAHLAVAPIERHDAAIEILHVEASIGKRIDQSAECCRVRPGRLEKVALKLFAFA